MTTNWLEALQIHRQEIKAEERRGGGCYGKLLEKASGELCILVVPTFPT